MTGESKLSPGKIILIDDDLDFIRMVGDSLNILGFEVLLFKDPRAALDTLRRQKISLVITDYHMDEITALDVISEVKEHDDSIPVVVLSGDPDQMIEKESLRCGALAFFTKPLDFERLMQLAGAVG